MVKSLMVTEAPDQIGTVSILLATYNGEKYIKQQLDSIAKQSYLNWVLYVSDDGSIDNTMKLIREFAEKNPVGKVNIFHGPGNGFADNFLFLLRKEEIRSDYYAFCDQDDVWLSNKLEDAIRFLNKDSGHYQLYGSRTTLVDNELNIIGMSPKFIRKFGLCNALIQSYAGGNTMVFTHSLKLLMEKLPHDVPIVSHDWFMYMLCAAFNGSIKYDQEPKIYYRQHNSNLVGGNSGFLAKIRRLSKIVKGEYKEWSKINYRALNYFYPVMPPESVKTIECYFNCKSKVGLGSAINFMKLKVYRQKKIETILFILLSFLGLII